MKRLLIIATFFVLATLNVSAQRERQYIRDSYKLYNDSDYVGAQEASVKAIAEAPNSFEAKYNYADALFKQEKIDEAQEQFESLAANEQDKSKLSKLYHNIGNCHYVKQEYDKSIESYKNALRADPQNNMSRYNLVAAQKMRDKKDDNQNQDQQQQQNQQQQQQQMDKEEAERLLDAVQQDENKLQEDRRQIREAQPRKIEKNW